MKIFVSIVLINVTITFFGQDPDWITVYEKSGHKATHNYTQTLDYAKQLADYSDIIEYQTFGKSPRGYDIPLLILDPTQSFNIEAIKDQKKAIILIQAAIHPGEPDGIDAGFMLFRDIAIHKKFPELIKNTVIMFIPSMNVDGHNRMSPNNRINQNGPVEQGWRTNSNNLNLNRDYLKIDSPELQAWVGLFNQWLPDFFIDCHTTDGADYQYTVTYIAEDNGNMNEPQSLWQSEKLLPYLTKEMEKDEHLINPYVSFRRWHDPRSGLKEYVSRPALSHGYTAIQNRMGLLIETHMLKDYKTRVEGTYHMLRHTIQFINDHYEELLELNKEADDMVSKPEFRKNPFVLDHKVAEDCTMVAFKGIDYTVETSDLTGGPWFKYNGEKKTFTLPFFNIHEPDHTARLPEAYIIPPEWTEVIKRLQIHGVKMKRLNNGRTIKINSYKFENVTFSNRPFEGRHEVEDFTLVDIKQERYYPKGSVIIDMNQRTARVIAHVLEPEAPDSYIHWGFFNAIFEQKEYAETYVMEGKAREMLEQDPELKKEFEKAKAENPQLFRYQWPALNWFYQHTEYWDIWKDVYPVGKIMDKDVLKSL